MQRARALAKSHDSGAFNTLDTSAAVNKSLINGVLAGSGFVCIALYVRQTRQPFTYRAPITREYFNVYEQNVSRIGILDDPLPRRIATFYTQANAILEDFHGMTTGAFEDVDRLIAFYEQLLELFRDTFNIADEILEEVQRRHG